ncbi:MAG: phage major capsid protein, partial [Pseudomonadota bacterium]
MADTVKVPARLTRAGEIHTRAEVPEGDADDRRVTLTFSSETPVLRMFGFEVLGHGEGEVDMVRLASGKAPLLTDHRHSIDAQVGVVESAKIEGTEGRATVRFGKSARASEILARVRDGEVSGVSVGYEILSLARVGEKDGEPILRAKWRPFEITLCPVPADATVGVGRDGSPEGREIHLKIEGSDMPKDTIDTTPAPETGTRDKAPAQPAPTYDPKAERARVKEIRALGRKFKVEDDKVDAALEGDTSVAAFQRQILDDMGSTEAEATRSKNAAIGLTDKETRSFSLLKAVRFLANPTDKRAREEAAFEIEASEAAQDQLGRDAKGLLVPSDVLTHQAFGRSQNVSTPTKGGNLVAKDYLEGSFIGLLRKRAALTRLGVRTLTGLDGNVAIPRQIGGGTAYWLGEGGAPTESDLDFNLLNTTPHTLGAAVPITRRAMIQATPDMESLVRDDLIRVMALEIDRVGLNGEVHRVDATHVQEAVGRIARRIAVKANTVNFQ